MSLRKISGRTLLFSAVLFCFVSLLSAEAQDVDVPGNLTMHDSADPTVGNILKEGVPFIHNFGSRNTFLGSGAGNFTMSGFNNTATGTGALTANTTGPRNTANGAFALENNTANGAFALDSNTTGNGNAATGTGALYANTTGNGNTAMGGAALTSNTTGFRNTACGANALEGNTTGDLNTANGSFALGSNTTGDDNTASGVNALFSNTTGSENTANGAGALTSNTIGFNNTASGVNALLDNTTGSYNTASGTFALLNNFTGNYNTALGYDADVLGNLNNATVIGAHAVVDASNKIRLGDTAITVIEGQVPYTYTSDRNQKEDFRPVDADEVLNKLRELSVTSWNYKGQDAKQFRHYGPVAQDFFAAFGRDAVGTIGTPTTITSGDLDGILMIAAQALEKRTVEQEKEIGALRQDTKALRAENADLKARLETLERRVGREFLLRVAK